jgi:alpha-1,2-mannosyltransferase
MFVKYQNLVLKLTFSATRSYLLGFLLLLISNCLAALYSPIQDCDEVFNYWEPTHYLSHGYGLQTWEYSPKYSIRSWLYIIPHAVIAKGSSIFASRKTVEFYLIRFALAIICAVCETRLFSAIYLNGGIGRRIGLLFLMIVAFSPGMFHASTALLPSSFAMYSSMLGLAAFVDPRGRQRSAGGIMWFGLGAIVGWPFAGVLIVPLLAKEIVATLMSYDLRTISNSIVSGAIRCLVVLVSLHLCVLQLP